jgi:hypothetical protein
METAKSSLRVKRKAILERDPDRNQTVVDAKGETSGVQDHFGSPNDGF